MSPTNRNDVFFAAMNRFVSGIVIGILIILVNGFFTASFNQNDFENYPVTISASEISFDGFFLDDSTQAPSSEDEDEKDDNVALSEEFLVTDIVATGYTKGISWSTRMCWKKMDSPPPEVGCN